MSVYVDQPVHRYGRMLMCHMLADTPEELHAMAKRIGVAHKWFQLNASTPHYDIARSKRTLALAHGAVEADRHLLVGIIRKIRREILAQTEQGLSWRIAPRALKAQAA